MRTRGWVTKLLVSLAVLGVLQINPTANAGHDDCRKGREINHFVDFFPDKVVSVFSIDTAACFTDKARVVGTIYREDFETLHEVSLEKTCRVGAACRFRLKLEHPDIEVADYEIRWDWKGPDRADTNRDNTSVSATCISTPLSVECI